MPAKTGASVGRRRGSEPALGEGHQLRDGRPRGEQPGVAGVDAAEQRLDQPVGDLGAEPLVDQVADRDVAVDRRRRQLAARGPGRAPRRRARPRRASWARSSGTPISERGSGRSAPRVQIRDDAVVGCSIGRPSARASSTPSGRRLSIASAPTSTRTPPTSARRSLPPTAVRASSTSTSCPAATRSCAAVRPAMPPPTTTTRSTTGPLCQRQGPGRGDGCGPPRPGSRCQPASDQPAEAAAVEDQRRGGVGVLDGVQLEQHDRVVARLDLAVDGAVEPGQPLVEGDRAVAGRGDRDAVEAVLDRARPAAGTPRRGGRRGS